MKYVCVNNHSPITIAVAKGYPRTFPDNGNMSLLFLSEVQYRGCPDMEVGEIYEASEEEVNYYGVPMLLFPGYYAWRPKMCFAELDTHYIEGGLYNEEGDLISISLPVEPWPKLIRIGKGVRPISP